MIVGILVPTAITIDHYNNIYFVLCYNLAIIDSILMLRMAEHCIIIINVHMPSNFWLAHLQNVNKIHCSLNFDDDGFLDFLVHLPASLNRKAVFRNVWLQ